MKIVRNTESIRHKRSSHTARAAKRRAVRQSPLIFHCVDGEGQEIDGEHRYVLLGVGEDQISDPNGLEWERIFSFLYSKYETGGHAYTGFFLGYDFAQWLKGIDEYKGRRLLLPAERAKRRRLIAHHGEPMNGQIYFPVDLEGWEIDMLGMRRMRLRPEDKQRWMYICDTGAFFQKSFLSVIDPKEWSHPVVTNEEYLLISNGKSQRDTAVLDDNMRMYNSLENEVLSRVLGLLDMGLRELGIHLSPKQWFGPGQAAQEWLTGRAPEGGVIRETVPREFLEATRQSYFGGWFDIMAHGIIPGESHEYDINSAYPAIISGLPCLLHGRYTSGSGTPPGYSNNTLLLVHATVGGGDNHIGAMLHRDRDGNISRPDQTEGWYWWHELEAASRAGLLNSVRVYEWHMYEPCYCPSPLGEIAELYQRRLEVGKKTPLGIAAKLIMNSCYGKFAQSVGDPKFGNPVYASLITAGCRTMILEAIATHPRGTADVLMVATDGVYFRSPHPGLPLSGDIGEWEHTSRWYLTLFKPGVYWDAKARDAITRQKAPVFKARGVNAREFGKYIFLADMEFNELRKSQQVPQGDEWPSVTFPLPFTMITPLQALHRGDWGLAGKVLHDVKVTQSSNPVLKRSRWRWEGDILVSMPPINSPFEASVPYEKRFGMDDPWSDESAEIHGIHPEGTPSSLMKEALYNE